MFVRLDWRKGRPIAANRSTQSEKLNPTFQLTVSQPAAEYSAPKEVRTFFRRFHGREARPSRPLKPNRATATAVRVAICQSSPSPASCSVCCSADVAVGFIDAGVFQCVRPSCRGCILPAVSVTGRIGSESVRSTGLVRVQFAQSPKIV